MPLPTAFALAAGLLARATGAAVLPEISLQSTSETTASDQVEIAGVRANSFDPVIWQAGTLNLVPDIRSPLLEPRPGPYRNIYAPSAVEVPGGWRVFYGGWDGVPTPNDRIYSAATSDFLSFTQRHTVIEHGAFVHACNVNALRLPNGSFALVCTVYPDAHGQNKPALFTSPDGIAWNGSASPGLATAADIVQVQGYTNYPKADINGMNVLFREGNHYRLYFGDFHNFGKVYRASSTDAKHYTLDGAVLDGHYAVNDLKKFRVRQEGWYLLGLHLNRERMWYALSRDSSKFPPAQTLATNLTTADRYIVALGWVVQGDQETPGRRLLGVLYGAGQDPNLARNRIFARWLQPRLVLVTDSGVRYPGQQARGPDRQLIPLGNAKSVLGTLELYAEDGRTLSGKSHQMEFQSGKVYRVISKRAED